MIQTDFILVRDGEKFTTAKISDKAKMWDREFPKTPDYIFTDALQYLKAKGYTVTVLDRSTMTRDEQREVFMLTRDASFYSYENLRWLIERADRADQLEGFVERVREIKDRRDAGIMTNTDALNTVFFQLPISNLLTPPNEKLNKE